MRKTIWCLPILVISALSFSTVSAAADKARLDQALAAQPADVQARYPQRHPGETLAFFDIEPGMTVVDTLPGGGWYTKILLPYLGADGRVIGADYPVDVWTGIGYDSAEFLGKRKTWVKDWTETAEGWRDANSAQVSAFVLGDLPPAMQGTADAVLFVRALHNLAYPEPYGSHLASALQDAYDVLKPGGIVGVVQHHARDDMSDAWASGENGYLKKGYVIEMMEAAGFVLAADSSVNANPQDRPTESEFVWRLPPGYSGAETPEQRAAVDAIGESNRMTLKFRKPAM